MISDAILIGNEWISEHYFTTETTKESFQGRVTDRRKAWDAEEKNDIPTVRAAFTAARGELIATFARIGVALDDGATAASPAATELAAESAQRLMDVLGFSGHGLRLTPVGTGPSIEATCAASPAWPAAHPAPVTAVSLPESSGVAPLVVVSAAPVAEIERLLTKDEATLVEPVTLADGDDPHISVARLLSALFADEHGPAFALVLAGRWALIAERERWFEGRYLAIDVQSVAERNDTRRAGEIDRALTCLSARSLAPDADGAIWWTAVLEESVKHSVGVSKDLRDGVRESIEIIANDVVARRDAADLPSLPPEQAQPLAVESLRFLYRILFLLYAEASPELGVLPVGAQEYDAGYSIDRLRDLIQIKLATPQARSGTHLYQSLATLFRLVDQGHELSGTGGHTAEADNGAPAHPAADAAGEPDDPDDGSGLPEGLTFHALRADLFAPAATQHIDEVGLSNAALQQVLEKLLLSKEIRGRRRAAISYADLGINQLGAVYEGLMSYTGFFATTDLREVAKGGDATDGSWVVPADRIDDVSRQDFVTEAGPDGEQRPVLHRRGTFVFRLSGRERQQSASYYTPEVLTRFTVGQALAELLDQDGETTAAAKILSMTVCEPALGSGAFAIEAVRQLAAQYLERRQKELGRRIDPDEYPKRLAETKAYIALHNVYGVDLNATAVELAEVSLWLDTMVAGLHAPWFGLHLRRGNSLIGARRAVYSRTHVSDKSWRGSVPRDLGIASLAADLDAGRVGSELHGAIHHFLLPAKGWGSAVEAKEAKALTPDAMAALKKWRSQIRKKPTKKQLDDLSELAHRVEVLWQFAYARLRIAEGEIRRSIPVWEAGELPSGGAVQREQIEAALADADGAYQRLRRVMDAWCALWFWPLTEAAAVAKVRDERTGDLIEVTAEPPTLDQWIAGLQALLGRSPETRARARKTTTPAFGSASAWAELGEAEEVELSLAGARPVDRVLAKYPWLQVCGRIAAQQGFFHWELDFATVFARGGFDLQVGNPPWVRPDFDEAAALAEFDVRWALEGKMPKARSDRIREETFEYPGATDFYVDTEAAQVATRAAVSAITEYPYLEGLRPDLYRCFMERTWAHMSPDGIVVLVHPESHFTDEKAGALRQETYARLRRHWQFINELKLYEIDHHVSYGVHIYGQPRAETRFLMASSLYHPDTVVRSFAHDGSGTEPGLKDSGGKWDQRPHAGRIITVDDDMLSTWQAVLETDLSGKTSVPIRQTRMVYAVNRSAATVLGKLAHAARIANLGLRFSQGWNETTDFKKGFFETDWGAPDAGVDAPWQSVILQGPHLHVATPLYKAPNKTMRNNLDWAETDFETLAADAIPVTAYKPRGDRAKYDASYTHWELPDGSTTPARDHYRVAWRCMAANTGERTLIPALIPPGAAHVDGIFSGGFIVDDHLQLAALQGQMSSLLADFAVRVAPKSTIRAPALERLPITLDHPLTPALRLRTLRLNCVTNAYAGLWSDTWDEAYRADSWTGGLDYAGRPALGDVINEWTPTTLLRRASDRRQALVEIDALVALMLGVTADELCTIYRTQFAVLYGYDHREYTYDAAGRLVPNSVLTIWRKKGEPTGDTDADSVTGAKRLAVDELTATNQAGNAYTYQLPFRLLDREADMRTAYAEFQNRMEIG